MDFKVVFSETQNSIQLLKVTQKTRIKKSELSPKEQNSLESEILAPDGGWGWVVCFAAGLSLLFINPPIQQYGILYRDRLFQLKFNSEQIVTIVNAQFASAKLTGIIHGPLYRRITFRQASIAGSLLVFIGIALSGFCINFVQYVVCYSLIYGIGMGLNISATMLAVNTYFKKNRKRAMGLVMSVAGVGPSVFPFLIIYLLEWYGSRDAIFILAALALNCLACSCILQPVSRRRNRRKIKQMQITLELNKPQNDMNESKNDENKDEENILNIETTNQEKVYAETVVQKTHKKKSRIFKKIIKFFELDLLKDLTFLNLTQGLCIMMLGELNFSFLTPFILGSYGFTYEDISDAMSLLAGLDFVVRFIAPFLLEKFKLSNFVLFGFGIVIVIFGRYLVTFNNSYYSILAIFLLIGFGKAFRTVFGALIIPTYVPLKHLPAAAGLQSVFEALLSMCFGPLLGLIIDASNYNVAIHVINAASCFSLFLWFLEWLVRRLLGKPFKSLQDK